MAACPIEEIPLLKRLLVAGGALLLALAGVVLLRTLALERNVVDAPAAPPLQVDLDAAFPRAHAALAREVVSAYSLLCTWQGRDESLAPALLMAHQDVVLVDEAD